MEEITEDERKNVVKEFLNVDDLVLLEDCWKKEMIMYDEKFESNAKKAKAFCNGEKLMEITTSQISLICCSQYVDWNIQVANKFF